jgi:hypothetical protein
MIENSTYTEEETEARREAALQRMFATPHKPRKAKGLDREKRRSECQTAPD